MKDHEARLYVKQVLMVRKENLLLIALEFHAKKVARFLLKKKLIDLTIYESIKNDCKSGH